MSNRFYTPQTDVNPGDTIKSAHTNDLDSAVDAAFDLIENEFDTSVDSVKVQANNSRLYATEAEDVDISSSLVPAVSGPVYSSLHHQAKAEAAKNAAETAKNAAETAQGLSEDARDAAQGYAGTAQSHANDSQLRAWEAEAEKKTADSYANEPEDTFVKRYTSNGDGTFTATDTTEYSALHWKNKAAALENVTVHTQGSGQANELLTYLKTLDGTGSGLDADLLDGQHGSYYLPASDYNATDVRDKLKTVDGAGSGVDADLLDGQHGSYYFPASAIPSGTKMLFRQTTPPTGWTKDTSLNDYMLRVVSGTVSSGGTDSPILMNKVPVHSHTASSSSNGSHSHTPNGYSRFVCCAASGPDLGFPNGGVVQSPPGLAASTNTTGAHTHSITVNNNSGSNWTPKYVDVIIATKN